MLQLQHPFKCEWWPAWFKWKMLQFGTNAINVNNHLWGCLASYLVGFWEHSKWVVSRKIAVDFDASWIKPWIQASSLKCSPALSKGSCRLVNDTLCCITERENLGLRQSTGFLIFVWHLSLVYSVLTKEQYACFLVNWRKHTAVQREKKTL